jgi:hypothetical protein
LAVYAGFNCAWGFRSLHGYQEKEKAEIMSALPIERTLPAINITGSGPVQKPSFVARWNEYLFHDPIFGNKLGLGLIGLVLVGGYFIAKKKGRKNGR